MLDKPESKALLAAALSAQVFMHHELMQDSDSRTVQDSSRGVLHGEAMIKPNDLPQKLARNNELVSLEQRETEILAALNGQSKQPGMAIPEGTDQLVVVTNDGWNDKTGHLQIFERDPKKGKPWHAAPGFSWPVNLGYGGMGWGAGGVIRTPEVFIDGQLERTGGPVEKNGKLDTSGHATLEGGSKAAAGLFKLGFAWGTALEAPAGTEIPYRHIDQFYRAIPQGAVNLADEQGNVLNGTTLRELNPQNGKYERFDKQSGKFLEGTLSPQVMQTVLQDNQQSVKYRNVNQHVTDRAGKVLTGLLVRMNESQIKKGENGFPVFDKNTIVNYTSLGLKSGKPGPSGTLDMNGARKLYSESDYRWSDDPNRGRAVIAWDATGKPILSDEVDDLYNMPLRIVDRANGEYEKLDPDTGRPVHLGFMEPHKLQSLINNVETLTYPVYRWAIDIRHNVNQVPNRGSAIFMHEENRNIEQGRPSGTGGCTSMSNKHIQKLIQHLDEGAMILQCPLDQLDTVTEALKPR